MIYFPVADSWWIYVAFLIFVFVVLAVDLGLAKKQKGEQSFRNALSWVLVWTTLAAVFNAALYFYCRYKFLNDLNLPTDFAHSESKRLALEFLAGYVMEQSLSVDNLFAFIVIFSFFRVPKSYQHHILFFGILGTIVCRGLFIFAGAFLMRYQFVVAIFGVFLLFTGFKLLLSKDHKDQNLSDEWSFKIAKRLLPITESLHHGRFWVREAGRLKATPLFLCLVVIEMTDVVFAVDSVPAIFGITREPLIVFTSNVFAILGLRSLYFLLAGLVETFRFLKYGLGCVLIFVGLKMTALHWLVPHGLSIEVSLLVIFALLGASILASVLRPIRTDQ